jgi:hypothetical protein
VAIAVGLRAQSRLPGTEFLDAETKRQKSPRKCANACRDQNPRREGPEIPAETPYLASYRKREVCKDWMVVCAARYEPVSLLFGQKQGDFREKQREDFRKYEIGPETRHFALFQSI